MRVAERERRVGSFLVGRLLPFRGKRQVGPFTFIDHMGPSEVGPGRYFDVDQHPHIGLSTLTYLITGEIAHRDSTGADRVITPGSVNFMTAGRGCTHTERSPAALRELLSRGAQHGRSATVHGYQVWVALPREREAMAPRFDHVAAADLPRWTDGPFDLALVAGEGYGRRSPLPVYSPLFMVDVAAARGAGTLDVAGELRGEIAVVVVAGEAHVGAEAMAAGEMLISVTDDACCLDLAAGSRVLLFGGAPLPEERFLYWNFVSSSRERLERAKADWRAWWPGRDAASAFGRGVDGDATYIPLPGETREAGAPAPRPGAPTS